MIKYMFTVNGSLPDGRKFTSVCIHYDILKAIELFKAKGLDVSMVEKTLEIQDDTDLGIVSIRDRITMDDIYI